MKDKTNEANTITFEFKISPNHVIHRVSGGYGGITPQGDIVINLYYERTSVPKKQTFVVTESGIGDHPIEEEKKPSLIRDVMVGLSMNAAVARSIAQWLNEKADFYDKMTGTDARIDFEKEVH
jgi:hypothetical protein